MGLLCNKYETHKRYIHHSTYLLFATRWVQNFQIIRAHEWGRKVWGRGGEGNVHLMCVGVGTFQVNKKQIVTAEQSHLWRFNTLIHTNALTHTQANCLYGMWNFSLRACNPFQATRFAPSFSPYPKLFACFAYFGYFYCMWHTGRIQISQDSTSNSPHLSDVFRFRI